MMRTENELTMRNLRNLNQELLAQVKEVGEEEEEEVGGDQQSKSTQSLLLEVFMLNK